jgi:ubiquinone/menaquinone biosynthesis C-methylase UbiE
LRKELLLKKDSSNSYTYKKRTIKIWNEIAPRYHKRWANANVGPFQSINHISKIISLQNNNRILDLACGTGAIINNITSKDSFTKDKFAVGVDSSFTAINIAKKQNKANNVEFIVADAETIHFKEKFDLVTCQFALFFFPNAQKTLRNLRKSIMKDKSSILITVHGKRRKVPYFDVILDSVTKFIPDYIPPGTPNLDRFGTKKSLQNEVKQAGFSRIKVTERDFEYSPGTVDDYWRDYLRYVATPLKEKLDSLSAKQRRELKGTIRDNATPYIQKDKKIIFPWRVLTLTAQK